MVIGQRRAVVKVQYALGKYGTEEEGKMCIDIFTFQKNAHACVCAHQGVVTFCFHNLHRNRGRRWGMVCKSVSCAAVNAML